MKAGRVKLEEVHYMTEQNGVPKCPDGLHGQVD